MEDQKSELFSKAFNGTFNAKQLRDLQNEKEIEKLTLYKGTTTGVHEISQWFSLQHGGIGFIFVQSGPAILQASKLSLVALIDCFGLVQAFVTFMLWFGTGIWNICVKK